MRIATAFALVLLLVASVGSVFADKIEPNEKPWEYPWGQPRAIIPEVEPNDTCPGQLGMVSGDQISPADLVPGEFDWYSFDANAGDWLTCGTDAYNGSSWDSYLELYYACGGTMVAYDDDSGPDMFSLITNYLVPQTGQYNAKVRGWSSSGGGPYVFNLSIVPAPEPPANDQCDGAEALVGTAGSIAGDLTLAVNNYDPYDGMSSCTGYPAAGKDVVYTATLAAGEILDLVYNTPNHDGSIYVITDCANPSGTCVIGEDDPEPEHIHWTCDAAGLYYIIVDAYGTNTGSTFTLDWSIAPPPAPRGACCVGEACSVTEESQCGGTWLGPNTDCSPNPCSTPTEETSWGQIKSNYR